MRRFLLTGAVLLLVVTAGQTDWVPYKHRYALIVMGGGESGQMYGYYWTDTSNMYSKLKATGFTDANIYFCSYGSSASGQSIVDKTSTRTNVLWALGKLASRSTHEDLVYIFWVDHGTDTLFNIQGGDVTHAEFGQKVAAIKARQVLIALNPCRSGSAIDDVSRDGVCVTSSVKPGVDNQWGWAGQWILGLTGGTSTSKSDANADGIVSFAEAYAWIAPRSRASEWPNEHPLYDDNGDKQAAEQGQSSFNMNSTSKDGFIGSRFGLSSQNRTRKRAYLDYLITRKSQSAGHLSSYFNLNFASYKASVVAACIQKLEADLNYHKIVFVGENDYAVRQRQYLDYLILRKVQSASQLSSYFGNNFSSTDWEIMAWCTRKLEMDLPVNHISFRSAAQIEARDRQYLDYLIQCKQQSASHLTNYFKINFSSQDPDEIWTCIRLLEKDFAVNNISHTPRPQWEAAGGGSGIPLVAPH